MRHPNLPLRDVIARRRGAYRFCFEGDTEAHRENGLIVMADLFHICGQGKSSVLGQVDPYRVVVMEGKRSVYLHIASMLRASDEDLWRAAELHARRFTDALDIPED